MGKIRTSALPYGGISDKKTDAEKIVWQSKLFPDLMVTQKMLDFLHCRYAVVKSWRPLMLDLEEYLTGRPDKVPKDFRRFILNCARRHADDVQKGYRYTNGIVNVAELANRRETVTREPSLNKALVETEEDKLRETLKTMERGTEEYEQTLVALQRARYNQPTLSIGEVFAKLAVQESLFQNEKEKK